MTKPRSHYVNYEEVNIYHITTRTTRRSWLFGIDPLTGRNHNHRKDVLINRLKHLTKYFSVKIMGYSIMSNHFHLVARYDPTEARSWSDEEVARRWCAVFNGRPFTESHLGADRVDDFIFRQKLKYHEILADADRLERCRNALGSLSHFMQHLKQPFAVWANHEDDCKGHFFESRFYSGILLSKSDLLACMAYVDLNPVEANMADTLREAKHTSVHERMSEYRFNADDMEAYLAPLWVVSSKEAEIRISVREYVEQLNLWIAYKIEPAAALLDRMESWMARLVNRERSKTKIPAPFFDYP